MSTGHCRNHSFIELPGDLSPSPNLCIYNCLFHILMWILIDNSKLSEHCSTCSLPFSADGNFILLVVVVAKILELSLMPFLFHISHSIHQKIFSPQYIQNLIPSPTSSVTPWYKPPSSLPWITANNLLIGHTAFILSPSLFLI